MNTQAQPFINKQFQLTPAENKAIHELKAAGYAFPANSDVGVIRNALRAAWKSKFPEREFPKDTE